MMSCVESLPRAGRLQYSARVLFSYPGGVRTSLASALSWVHRFLLWLARGMEVTGHGFAGARVTGTCT